MSTVRELHLAFNQRAMEVASHKRDKFFPQEVDMYLNKAMYRLLEQGVNKRFQDAEVNLSHVTALLKKNKISEVIIPSTSDPLYEEHLDSVYATIPPDLYWLINGRVETINDTINCEEAPTLATQTLQEWKCVVPFPAANASSSYWPSLVVSSTVAGTLYTAPSPISTGVTSTSSAYVYINSILETLYSHATIRCYWERYRDTYSKNSFIFVAYSNQGTFSITATGVTTSSAVMSSTNYTKYNRALIPNITNGNVTLAPVKVQEANLLYSSLKENVFYKTKQREVSCDQTFDYFTLYRDESFIITRFYYDYIRKPRTISLLLNQSCELADTIHPKIVDLAVELMRLDTKDQAYPATVQDIELRTQ